MGRRKDQGSDGRTKGEGRRAPDGTASPQTDLRPSSFALHPALLVLVLVLLLGLLPRSTAAQVPPDTTVTPADTTLAPSDSLRPSPDSLRQAQADTLTRPPVGFAAAEPGTAVLPTRPARLPVREATEILGEVPATFVYDFGELGWPDGWSPQGLPPHGTTLLLDGRPFDDLITGRPRYDLLPLAFLSPLRIGPGRHGSVASTLGQVRAYDVAEPLTELRYQTGQMQSVTALHTQQRRRPLFGQPGILNVLFGYGGHAVPNAYPGGRLRRARQVYGRVRYEQAAFSVELSNLHTRWQLGAHGGVLATRVPFALIYEPFGAATEHDAAERQTLRNDLALTARFHLGLSQPLTLTGFWTSEIFRYTDPNADTLATRANRYGWRAVQDARLGRHHLRLRAEGWSDGIGHTNALPDSLDLGRTRLHVALRDSLHVLGTSVEVEGSLHTGSASFPAVNLALRRPVGPLELFADGQITSLVQAWVAQYGYGTYVQPPPSLPESRLMQGRAGISLRAGPLDVTGFGYANELTHPTDFYTAEPEDYVAGTPDSLLVLVGDVPLRHAGLGGDLGLRRHAERGLYLTTQATLNLLLDEHASELHERQRGSLPMVYGQARLGVRALLFQGDLDMDLSLRGRFWTEMRSRTLHPPTGLLAVTHIADRIFGPSGVLDVYFVGRVRTATLFLTYENVLGRTQLQVGSLIVPVYPLPNRRIRFGVFWPISN